MSPTPSSKPKEPTPRLTLCLAMDLKGSTASGLRLSTKKLDRFNLALVDQLTPHLRAVQLEHAVVKFTGDGWLVMSDEQEDAAKLCCLATIMARRFRYDISQETGFRAENVPAMRLALCWGRDLPVTLPGGLRDFVGNSVRHAVRACQLCQDNEILVDETVRAWISLDFVTSRVDLEGRMAKALSVKMEEELVLHVLENMKTESAADEDAPIYFVNTLAIIGQTQEADHLASRISERLRMAVDRDPEQLLARWNDLLNSNLDYDTARDVLTDLINSGLAADVRSYNALIEKADSWLSENRWLQLMIENGVRPNLDTFNILLEKARSDEDLRERWSEMQRHAVVPDPRTALILIGRATDDAEAARWVSQLTALGGRLNQRAYEAFIDRAEDFRSAQARLTQMIADGYEPSEEAFIDAFSKGVTVISADELLKWYLGLRYHPTHPIKRAIAEYRKAGQFDDALRLALDYPHTDTALKTIRQNPVRAIEYFRRVVDMDPNHANGAYAMAMTLLQTRDHAEAAPWLRRAYDLATPGTRKDELARYLNLFDSLAPGEAALL